MVKQITVSISGVDETINRISALSSDIKSSMTDALVKGANRFRDESINYLWRVAKKNWPMSTEDKAIRNPETWVIPEKTISSVVLSCDSEHAGAVEFGTSISSKLGYDGKFHSVDLTSAKGPFPVGKNQYGMPLAYSYVIKPQPGYSYVRSTMYSPTSIEFIINDIGDVLKNSIRKTGV